MKKGLLFLASLLVSVASFAQWTSPITADDGEEVVIGEKYFLYNLEAGGFLKGANDWQTRASISTVDADTVIIEEAAESLYRISVYAQRDNMGWRYMSCNSWDGMWIDGKLNDDGYPGTEEWKLNKAEGSNVYTLANAHVSGTTFGISGIKDGAAGDTRCYMLGSADAGDKLSGTQANKWVFVSNETFEAKLADVAVFHAAFVLKETLDAAKAKYPSLDFSEPQGVYNNIESDEEELAAATAKVSDIINDYLANQATFDEPFDLSESIGSNQSSYRPWVRTFTGSGEVGTETWNTWSGEAPGDGTDMTNPFRETWTSGGGLLSDMKITQTLENASPGLYKLTIDARLYSESGAIDEFKGAEMFFGETRIDMQAETPITKINDTKFLLWNPHYFNIIAIVKEAGDIEFGFEFTQPNFNWLAFKNVSLKYYGNKDVEANAAKLAKAIYNFEKADPETVAANPSVIAAYNEAVDAFDAAPVEDIKTAAAAAEEAKAALNANIKAHETWYAKYDVWFNNFQNTSASGPLIDDFGEFLQTEEEDAELEGYPVPSAGFIMNHYPKTPANQYPFTTAEEVDTYIATVDGLWSNAIANSAQENDDMTSLLVNPDFGSSTSKYDEETGKWSEGTYNLNGWTNETNSSINLGGLRQLMCCEVYDQAATFYQIVKGAPAGLYKIETQAYDRPGSIEASADNINYYLFMNKFETRIPHVITDPLIIKDEEKSNIVDGGNVWLTTPSDKSRWSGSNYDGGYDNLVTTPIYAEDGETVLNPYGAYCPNNMYSAAMHFDDGRYKVSTYGLVGDGEDMKIGVTSHGNKVTNEWFIFSGFKLTFMGKNPEAISSVLADKWIELDELVTEKEESLTTSYKTTTTELLAKTKGMNDANTTADDLWQALQDVIDAIAEGTENVAAGDAFLAAKGEIETAAEALVEYEGGDKTEEYTNYDKVLTPKMDAWQSLSTEDLKALTEEVKEATEAINAKIAELEKAAKIAEMAGATDDEPVDVTEVFIKNWNFETFENGAFPGWEYWKEKGKGPEKGSGIDGRSFETWTGNSGGGAALNFKLSQNLGALPAGTYAVSALAYHFSNGNSGDIEKWNSVDEETGESTAPTGRVYLYALIEGEGEPRYASIPVEPMENTSDADINGLQDEYSAIFKVNEGETVTIGFQTVGTQPFQWFGADNFNLQYYGTQSGYEANEDEGGLIEVGIADVKAGAQKFGKFIQNKSIVIFKNGKKYNVAGQAIK